MPLQEYDMIVHDNKGNPTVSHYTLSPSLIIIYNPAAPHKINLWGSFLPLAIGNGRQ